MTGELGLSKRLKPWVPYCLVIVLFGVVGAHGISMFEDLWYHLLTGKYIIANYQIPHTGFLVFNHAQTPMMYHSWLTQVILYLVFSLGGLPLLQIFNVFLGVLTGLTLYLLHRRRADFYSFFVLLPLTAFVARFFLNLRPNVFSLMLFAGLLILLDSFREMHSTCKVAAIGLILLLWSTLHGFWIYGLVLTGLFAAEAFIKRNLSRWVPLTVVIVLVFIVAGFCLGSITDLLSLPQNGVKVIRNNIHEWYSPLAALTMLKGANDFSSVFNVVFFRVIPPVILIVGVGVALIKQKRPLIDYLLGAFFAGLTLFSYRNTMFMLPIFIYVFSPYLETYVPKSSLKKRLLYSISILLQVILIIRCLLSYSYLPSNPYPLESLVSRLPLTTNLLIAHPYISDYVLFLTNKDSFNERNVVLYDVRAELYSPQELAHIDSIFQGNLKQLPVLKSGNLFFLLSNESELFNMLAKNKNFEVIGSENTYSLVRLKNSARL